jgi:hypothetical protein
MQENILKIGFQSSECAGFLYLKILKAHHWLVVWKYESLFIIILSHVSAEELTTGGGGGGDTLGD